MNLAIPKWNETTIPVIGDNPFPVRRIFCVGRNYAAHAREMGHDPDRDFPFFFMKPFDAIVPTGSSILYPSATNELHHEVELVVALKKGGLNIEESQANSCIYGYAVGLDMTRRDIQGEAKKLGRPWDMAKGFDNSAPCAPIHKVENTGIIENAKITLSVNGKIRQQSNVNHLIWSISETISYLSALVELKPGDLIYSGTPDGVAEIKAGDCLHGQITGLTDLNINYL
jgi:fumarylpyruvate hydrolase